MRDERFDLEVSQIEWLETDSDPIQPELVVQQLDESDELSERLTTPNSTKFDADEFDVTCRFQSAASDDNTCAIFAISNNLTGEFVCEVQTDASIIQTFVTAVRRYAEITDHNTDYSIRFRSDETLVVAYEKRILLVFGADGTLLRQHSLIPSEVEI